MSSMVQDAYDMGITTSLGGMPRDSFYENDDYDSSDDNYDNYDSSDDEKYEIGNTVRLNSGGPLMTIEEIDDEVITCRWFNTENDLKSAQFYKNEVTFATDDEENTEYMCDECYWSGTEDELDEDGDCPECGNPVTEI